MNGIRPTRRVLLQALLLCGVGGCAHPEEPAGAQQQPTFVTAGWYAGECAADCVEQITIDVRQTRYERVPLSTKPDSVVVAVWETDPLDWDRLLSTLDIAAFLRLPERIGCPDCVDQGGFWVDVSVGATRHRVDFDPADHPEAWDELLEVIVRLLAEGQGRAPSAGSAR